MKSILFSSCLIYLTKASHLKKGNMFPTTISSYMPTQAYAGYPSSYMPAPLTTIEKNTIGGITDSTSQKQPNGGSQSTSTGSYGQQYLSYQGQNPLPGTIPTVAPQPINIPLISQPSQYVPNDNTAQGLLNLLMANMQNNASLGQAGFGKILDTNSLGLTQNGANAIIKNLSTGSQNLGVSSNSSGNSNAGTDSNNLATASNTNNLNVKSSTMNQGTNVSIH